MNEQIFSNPRFLFLHFLRSVFIFILVLVSEFSFGQTESETLETAPGKAVTYTSTGIIETQVNDIFNVFPNPNRGTFSILYSSEGYGSFKIIVLSQSGKVVYAEDIPSFIGEFKKDIDLSMEMKGFYYVKIISASGMQVRKIIME